jgi:hypothetical protein
VLSPNLPLSVVWDGQLMGDEWPKRSFHTLSTINSFPMLMFSWFKVSLVVNDKRVCEKELPVISDHKVVMTKGLQS